MLYGKLSAEKYKGTLIKKLSNFCDKAPILLKFITSDRGVTIIHVNSDIRYQFDWDFDLPIKTFIFNIKSVLLEKHYPRMVQVVTTSVALTAEEQARLFEDSDSTDVPTTKIVEERILWTITRVLVYKDIFLIQRDGERDQYRFKMNRSCIHFLQGYRNNEYTLESAAEFFFKNSQLIDILAPSDDSTGE